MSRRQRQRILNKLSIRCEFGEGWVSVSEIDKAGLAKALKLGVARSLSQLQPLDDEEIILDGVVDYIPKIYINRHCQPGADITVPIVSAAAIYAKVTRDAFMYRLSLKHPLYKFDSHVGYGTKAHLGALKSHGYIASVHRTSFRPIREMVAL
jgi:ribonuclease HII